MRSRRVLPALVVVLALAASACIGGSGTYQVSAEFARTYNLFPGSPVRVLGIEVGKVAQLHTDPQRDHVLVDLVIDDGVQLPADVTATIIPQSLLGERYVQFDPPYTGGEQLEAGAVVPRSRTQVPAEFDEILESLNTFVGGLDEDEFARFMDNLAAVLDEQGESLGRTIDQAHAAIQVLEENDDQLVSLARRLADLNETVATRDEQLAQLLVDWNTVAGTIIAERDDLDRALDGLVRLTTQLAGILEVHREDLQDDIATLTRIARTADRNIDNLSSLILWGAELFRHAERVVEREQHGWLPLVNHSGELGQAVADNLADRLEFLCTSAGLPAEQCELIRVDNLVPGGEFCLEPLVPCPEEGTASSVEDVLRRTFELVPGLERELREQGSPLAELPGAPVEEGVP